MSHISDAKRLLCIALSSMLVACGGGGSNAAAPAPVATVPAPVAQVRPGTWAVIGSSTAAGAGAAAGKGWVALLASEYAERGAQIENLAKGGTVTYHGLSVNTPPTAGRPAPDAAINIDAALARKPVLLIVSYPTNDTALGYSTEETVKNLLAIRTQALAAGVPVVVTSTQPRDLSDAQLSQLAAIDQRLAAAVGPCFVEIRQKLAGTDGRLAAAYDSSDRVHPNEAGHSQIMASVKDVVEAGKCVQLTR